MKPHPRRRTLPQRVLKLAAILLVGCLSVLGTASPLGERLEAFLTDMRFRIRGPTTPPAGFVVVAIDELSYTHLGVPLNQAWPRELHAKLLQRLKQLGAKRVVFDILFLDAGPKPSDDAELASALKLLPTVLGAEVSAQQISGPQGSFSLEQLLEPLAPLRDAASAIALVGLPDDNGSVRRFLTTRSAQSAAIPSLAEAAVGMRSGDGRQRPAPSDLINFFGPSRTIPVVSLYEVLDDAHQLPATLIRDATVFVGLLLRTETGPAQKDVYGSPFPHDRLFGVELHATAAANLASGTWIRRPGESVEISTIAIGSMLSAAATILPNPLFGGTLLLVIIATWLIGSFIAFTQGMYIGGAFSFLLLLPLTFFVSTLYHYVLTRRRERAVSDAFEHYLSPAAVRELSNDADSLKLGGEKLWATALFTDIRGFTNITEEMPAEKVSEMLNEYFSEVVDAVFAHQGTLMKFIGDAVFVVWGAPLKIQNHAERALHAAVDIQNAIEHFNARGEYPRLETRIGVHTGPMLIGNLGSRRRFDYTAIGDSVNLASRVEGANRHMGTTILFTEATRRDAGAAVQAIPVGLVQVSGKRERIALFTTLTTTPLTKELLRAWSEGISAFQERRFTEGLRQLSSVVEQEPRLRGVLAAYEVHTEQFSSSPPPPNWGGELVFDAK